MHVYTVGEEEQKKLISELEGFIAQLLKMVEVELSFNYETLGKISSQIHGNLEAIIARCVHVHVSRSWNVKSLLFYL